jgi:hypothetical protein
MRCIAERFSKVIRRTADCEEENEKPAACKHEWEKIDGGSTDFTADHSAVIYTTYLKCKLCGEEGVIEHADYH